MDIVSKNHANAGKNINGVSKPLLFLIMFEISAAKTKRVIAAASNAKIRATISL